MSDPEVSLIIPVFNGRRFLRKAVRSALDDGVSGLEIVVVDDGSTDGSLESVADLPIVPVLQPRNLGIANALNRGLDVARGRFIAFLDADDRLSPGGLRWRIDWLKAHPSEQAVGGRPAAIVDEREHVLENLRHVLTPGFVPPRTFTLQLFQDGRLYPTLLWLFLFRREFIDQVGRLDTSLRSVFDSDFLFRAARRAPIPIVFEPVAFRRWHRDNHSHEQGRLGRTLKPGTIEEIKKVAARYGIPTAEEFHLWETGFQPLE